MKKYLIIGLILLTCSCKRKYEKKILKVTITSTQTTSYNWDEKGYGFCETNGLKEMYVKEGTTLSFKAVTCGSRPSTHLVVKVGERIIYEGDAVLHTFTKVIERRN